ncbi:MAG TPA: alkaline phosphatase family protein [Acidimicrobiales bacterium]|nr:alkaline phosphatase family protein [Acidimicrobiales bacterium]
MAVDPVVPRYTGRSLAGLVPALRADPDARPGWLPGAARSAPRCVLLVLDGLGHEQWWPRRAMTPTMAAMAGVPIESVAPTTTATALTSITTGAAPADHGLVGYRLVVDGPDGSPEVMNALRWRTASGDARAFVDPVGFVRPEPFGGDPVPVVSRRDFEGSGFSTAHLRGTRSVGWSLPSTIPVAVARLVDEGEAFVYAYYEGVDKIAHIAGLGDEYDAELVFADRLVADLLDVLPPDVALVVTADHGEVEVGDRVEPIDEAVLEEAALVSGEARFRWFHARPGRAAALAALVAERYGQTAWVRTVEEVEEGRWFGGALDPVTRARLGDVALAACEPVAYLEPADGDTRLVCRHGSLTAAEVVVPLLAAPGRRAP